MKFKDGFIKTALSKTTLLRAADVAQKRVALVPPGMLRYSGVKPVQQLQRFQEAAKRKK